MPMASEKTQDYLGESILKGLFYPKTRLKKTLTLFMAFNKKSLEGGTATLISFNRRGYFFGQF